MPLYEYECGACGAVYEESFSMSTYPKRIKCLCGAQAVKVILTAPAIAPDQDDFSRENAGRGRYNPQLRTYTKSTQDTIDQGKARGWSPL